MSKSDMTLAFMEIILFWKRWILIAKRELNYYYKIKLIKFT